MLDSSNLPSQTDLNSLYGAWNPMSYMQGQQNQDIASQFRNQAFQANQNNVQEGAIKNDQATQMNPLLLDERSLLNQGQDLTNKGKGISNKVAQLGLERDQATQGDQIASAIADLKSKMTDSDFARLSTAHLMHHMQLLSDPNATPDDIAASAQLMDYLGGPTASKVSAGVRERNLAELGVLSKAQQAAADRESQQAIAGMQVEGRQNVAEVGAKSREEAARMHMNIANKIAAEMDKPADQRDMQKVDYLTRVLQTTSPAWAGGVDVNALGGGQGLRANVPANPAGTGVTSSGTKYRIVPTGQ